MTQAELRAAFDHFIRTYEDSETVWTRRRFPNRGTLWSFDLTNHGFGCAQVYWLGAASGQGRLNICWSGKRVVIFMDGRSKPSTYSVRGSDVDLVEARLLGLI